MYNLDDRVLQSWLHHLTVVRNTCAHHARLWNREITVTPQEPRSKPAALAGQFQRGSRKQYNTLLLLVYLMDIIAPNHHWRVRLKDLIQQHQIPAGEMGFPAGWDTLPLWR